MARLARLARIIRIVRIAELRDYKYDILIDMQLESCWGKMFIVTLPSANKTELIKKMFAHPSVDGARYNVGIRSTYNPTTILSYLQKLSYESHKKLWIDLKGRQLRITKWADQTYGDIELNHEISVDLPAKVFFRGNEWSNIVGVEGNRIVVDPDPKYALGAGQAINIIGTNLKIKGNYLTGADCQFIEASKNLGVHDYMLSFVEDESDISAVRNIDPQANVVLKIESLKGLDFIAQKYIKGLEHGNIMAARDDMMINIGSNKSKMLDALELIIHKDSQAIAASHIFNSLSTVGYLTMSDISDVKMLHDMGYKNFMLSDNVSHHCFDDAMRSWQDFKYVYNFRRLLDEPNK